MPELPEVETVVRGLNDKVSNKTIREIELVWNKVFSDGSNPDLLTGKKIKSVTRRAKYIVFNFVDSDLHLISHLRMTGKYLFNLEQAEEKFLRCVFKFTDGTELYYLDMRKFGKFDICTDLKERFSHIGAEPLTDDLNVQYLKPLLQRDKPIKNFLMDQQYIAGLGNIYTDEVLFLSKIHPQRHSSSLSDKEIKLVIKNVKDVLGKAVDNMGTTLSDYRNTDNVAGENQNYLYVYGRNKAKCKVCGTVIEKIKMGGRGTHFCPKCQK
jgi:formamidopyrimidine-DNA glycosylase